MLSLQNPNSHGPHTRTGFQAGHTMTTWAGLDSPEIEIQLFELDVKTNINRIKTNTWLTKGGDS